jgi:hypothetical protein
MLQSIQRLDMRTNALEARAGVPTPAEGNSAVLPSDPGAGISAGDRPNGPKPGELIERDITQ